MRLPFAFLWYRVRCPLVKFTDSGPWIGAQSGLNWCCPQDELGIEQPSQDEPDALEKQREGEQSFCC